MATRREFFAIAGMASVAACASAASEPKKYGRLGVDSHRSHKAATGETIHVTVDGHDVTSRCCEADDVEGWADVFCRDPQHHRWMVDHEAIHIDAHSGGACRMRLRGRVVIAPGADL